MHEGICPRGSLFAAYLAVTDTAFSVHARGAFRSLNRFWVEAAIYRAQVLIVVLCAEQKRALAEMEHSGLIPLIQQDKLEDLSRMYTLFRRVDGGAELMRKVCV